MLNSIKTLLFLITPAPDLRSKSVITYNQLLFIQSIQTFVLWISQNNIVYPPIHNLYIKNVKKSCKQFWVNTIK